MMRKALDAIIAGLNDYCDEYEATVVDVFAGDTYADGYVDGLIAAAEAIAERIGGVYVAISAEGVYYLTTSFYDSLISEREDCYTII